MEFRSLIQKIFGNSGNEPDAQNSVRMELINDWKNVFFSSGLHTNDILVKTCVDVIAKHAAKLKPTHIVLDGGKKVPAEDSALSHLLTLEPNPYMTAYDMLYRVTASTLQSGNGYIKIKRDARGRAIELWPLDYMSTDIREVAGELYVKFVFMNGKRETVPYADLIHIRNFFQKGDIVSDVDSNLEAVLSLLETLQQSFENAAVNSGKIKGVAQIAGQIGSDQWKQKSKLLMEQIKDKDTGGIVTTDGTISFTPNDTEPVAADHSQLDYLRENVYRYFGISKEIVANNYTEAQWQAFFESTIEPLAIRFSQEFTRKIFTAAEIAAGNRIIFDANRLTYATTATKTEMIRQLRPLGVLTTNQCLEIMNLPPVDDGDDRLVQTLNLVNTQLVDEYQKAKAGKEVKGDDEGENDSDGASES